MKSYVINLDRSPERLAAFTAQAAKAGISFERFSAIDGKFVPQADLRSHLADKFEFQPINIYEIALFLSHRALWQRLVDSGDECCAIYEDDVVLSARTVEAYGQIEALVAPFDVVKLETTKRKIVLGKDAVAAGDRFAFHMLKSWHGGTAGYVVSAGGAAKLLDMTRKVADPIDQVMFNPLSSISNKLDIVQTIPATAIQLDILQRGLVSVASHSTIERQSSGKRWFRHGPWIDLRRAMMKLYASFRRRIAALSTKNSYAIVQFDGEV